MDGESAALDEGLSATLLVALVGSFVGVNAEVSLEVGFTVEAFAARTPRALEWAGGGFSIHDFEQVHSV